MAKNSISYEARISDKERKTTRFGQSRNGRTMLQLTLAEQHQAKNKSAPKQFQKPEKGPEDYVNTTTSWHRLTIWGEEAEHLAQDADFNHGATVVVTGASYQQEPDYIKNGETKRGARSESLPDDGSIVILERAGYHFGPFIPEGEMGPDPIWDGISPIPTMGGSGGGGNSVDSTPVPSGDEGF